MIARSLIGYSIAASLGRAGTARAAAQLEHQLVDAARSRSTTRAERHRELRDPQRRRVVAGRDVVEGVATARPAARCSRRTARPAAAPASERPDLERAPRARPRSARGSSVTRMCSPRLQRVRQRQEAGARPSRSRRRRRCPATLKPSWRADDRRAAPSPAAADHATAPRSAARRRRRARRARAQAADGGPRRATSSGRRRRRLAVGAGLLSHSFSIVSPTFCMSALSCGDGGCDRSCRSSSAGRGTRRSSPRESAQPRVSASAPAFSTAVLRRPCRARRRPPC